MPETPTVGTREQILNAALHRFAYQGYPQTSLDEIAKDVGITKPAIYHYFPSKEVLFNELVNVAKHEHYRRIHDLTERRLPLSELIAETVRGGLAIVKENPDWMRMMLRMTSMGHELEGLIDIKQVDAELHGTEARMFESAVVDVKLRPGVTGETLVHFVHAILFSFISRCLFLGEPPEAEAIPERLRDLILYGVCER
jgi:AcrR family transcriptional regulator